MAVDPERPLRKPGHQRTVPDVLQAVAGAVGCVALAGLREVVEQTLTRYDDLDRLTRGSVNTDVFVRTKWGSSAVAQAMT